MKKLINQIPEQLTVFTLFLCLSIIVGWPILTQLDHVLIGHDPDIYINPWANWWTKMALANPELSLWRTDFMFFPSSANLAYHSFSHLNSAIAILLEPLFGTLPAHNISLWLNYPFIAFSMYHLARYLTKNQVAAILAGIAFAFNSHAMYQSSHPVLLSIWCFPWATLFLLKAIDEDKSSYAILAGFFVFLGTITSALLFFMMVIYFAFLTGYFWLSAEWKSPSWKILIIFAITSALLCVPTQYPLLVDFLGNRNSSFVISNEVSIVADIISPIIPHWIVWMQRGIYFGFLGIYLMLLSRKSGGRVRIWVILLVSMYLISIGPNPLIMGQPLDIVLPWSYLVTPILRNTYRFNILISIGLSLLIAYGWIGLSKQIVAAKTRQILAIAIPMLLFAEYGVSQIPHVELNISPFFTQYLDDVEDEAVLTIIPSTRQNDKYYLYLQTLHGHKMTNGVISRPEKDTFQFIESNTILATRLSSQNSPYPPDNMDEALDELKNIGVEFLIIDRVFLADDLETLWQDAMQSSLVYEDDLVFAYKLAD
ncbi:MAG: hypothetical protein AAF902_03695 [Chloroflexota bacterium]